MKAETRRIPAGDLGTLATVREMRKLVDKGVRNPLTVRLASAIVEGAHGHRASQAMAIRGWLDLRTVYQDDPYGIELLRSVPEMLADIRQRGAAALDCDDVAILGAALGKAVGLRPRFVLFGFEPSGPYRHIFTELATPEGWVDLDITRPPRLPPVARSLTVPV
jgi:transglutaminase-like putative cysteine protease